MKKILAVLVCIPLIFCLFSCGEDKEETPKYEYELAFITESEEQSIDDEDYTQSAWEGLREFAEDEGLTYKYYEPAEDSMDGRLEQIDAAASAGAKVISCAGKSFEEVIYTAQEKYEDITFILLDGKPRSKDGKQETAKNTISVSFKAADAGYLAGYAAVTEGYRHLGFIGDAASETAKNYGYGFIQGCNDASSDHGGYPTVEYLFSKKAQSAAQTQKRAEEWYNNGVEAIFACGGDTFNSVAAEADIAEKKVIGAGTNKNNRKTVIASVVMNYGEIIKDQLSEIYQGNVSGGKNILLGADENAVELFMKKDAFTYFTAEDYDGLYEKLQGKNLKRKEITRENFPAIDLIISK